MNDVRSFFQKQFGTIPLRIVQAPGRLELLGNHTDYNEGLVMSLAIDKYIYMASSPRNDGQIELTSSAFAERDTFYIDKIEKNPRTPWANYVKGVLLQLRQRGVRFSGFNAAIHGTIPLGAGLSSSAALEMATALTIRELFPFTLTEFGTALPPARTGNELPPLKSAEKILLAKIGQAAESQFVGANVGLLDQISSLFGKAGQVIQIDCRHQTVTHNPMVPGVAVVVCNSGVKHDLSAGEYNELRSHCESAARTLGVKALRSINPQQLEASKAKLSQRDYECAYHVVGENQRVVFGERALLDGDVSQFGEYLFQSHASSRDYFKNSIPELDALVDIARRHPACYGARLTGGGFGGATINLVKAEGTWDFQQFLAKEYQVRTGLATEPWTCSIVDGAR
ncbi:MAG: galactokinase family protein [Verrucomicrobiota bacterium]|nr:galactokinase family protein [Verrucomicrobiota bacterium]